MKKIFLLCVLAAGLSPVLFSSCSTIDGTAMTTSGGNSIADHEHYSTAAMGYENIWPYGPNAYR